MISNKSTGMQLIGVQLHYTILALEVVPDTIASSVLDLSLSELFQTIYVL